MPYPKKFVSLVSSFMLPIAAQGSVLYNESSAPDLSDDFDFPTIIIGSGNPDEITGFLGPATDLNDFFVLNGLPPGQQVTFFYTHTHLVIGQDAGVGVSYTVSDANTVSKIDRIGPLFGKSITGALTPFQIPASGALHVHLEITNISATFAPESMGTPKTEGSPGIHTGGIPEHIFDTISWSISLGISPVPEPSTSSFFILSSLFALSHRIRPHHTP